MVVVARTRVAGIDRRRGPKLSRLEATRDSCTDTHEFAIGKEEAKRHQSRRQTE